jgi:hypothetical protein
MKITQEKADEAINIICQKERNTQISTILDVLENDMNELKIEESYQNDIDPWIEQDALNALNFLNGEIKLYELLELIRKYDTY